MSWARPHHHVTYRPATDVGALALGAATVALVAPGSLTPGRFGLFRWDLAAHAGGPDPHFHTTFSESFYVLNGTLRLGDGTTWRDATGRLPLRWLRPPCLSPTRRWQHLAHLLLGPRSRVAVERVERVGCSRQPRPSCGKESARTNVLRCDD